MTEEDDYQWLADIAKSFGLEGYNKLNHMAGRMLMRTAPGQPLNNSELDYCNTPRAGVLISEAPYTPQDLHEVMSLIALGVQKASDKYGEIMDDFMITRLVNNQPVMTSYYSPDDDSLVVTSSLIHNYMFTLRYQRSDAGSFNVTRDEYPGMKFTAEESIVLSAFEKAFIAHQQKQLGRPVEADETALLADFQQERIEAGREFIKEMREGHYIGNFIAATAHVFKDMNLGRGLEELKQHG